MLGGRGLDLAAMDDESREQFLSIFTWGGPDEVGEQLGAVLDAGLDGFTCNLVANGHNPERVELLGETASQLLD